MLHLLAALAAPVLGQADASQPAHVTEPFREVHGESAVGGDEVIVQAEPFYPSVGINSDHMHDAGEVMVGLDLERSRWSGMNQRGTRKISDDEILAGGFSSRTKSMSMTMIMLDLMYAPNDKVTLMLMPHYMWHRMAMVGIDPAAGQTDGGGGDHDGHGGHAIGFGEIHEHKLDGFGDTFASASFRLARNQRLNAHFTLGLWLPTGSSDRKNPDGTFVHYGMQPGSGTWDVEPSLTIGGKFRALGWGAQAAYRWRITEANGSGFRLGAETRLNGWLSYALRSIIGATARVEYSHQGIVEGHYNAAHNHSAPPDRQQNYGGRTVLGAIGLDWRPPARSSFRPELGLEVAVPLYQDLNGIQAPLDWKMSMAIRQTLGR